MAVWCNHQCLTRHTANVQAGTSSRPQAERGTLPPPLPFSQVLQLILSHLATELSLRSPSSHRVLAHGPTQPGLQKAQPGSHLLLSGLSTRAGFLVQRHPGSLSLCGDNLRLTPQAEDNHSALTTPFVCRWPSLLGALPGLWGHSESSSWIREQGKGSHPPEMELWPAGLGIRQK